MKKIIVAGLLLASVIGTAAVFSEPQWENPAEKYAEVYKKYQNADDSFKDDGIRHFVFFARDRDSMHNHPMLDTAGIDGAQIMYSWKQLEPEKGEYNFAIITDDLNYLQAHGKKLFIQLQDATFNPSRIAVPDYLLSDEYGGGAVCQYDDAGVPEGWVAKRWNPEVQKRFALFMSALGKEFDGKIEGINLQESAIGVSNETDPSFTPEIYVEALKTNMFAMKKAFPKSVTMQYANFMPGEWLPWEDRGYLNEIYRYGENIGVGLGGPDLMVRSRGQLNHTAAMMHESKYSVPLGIAVQDGNYIGKTGTDEVQAERENIVPLLHDFAVDFMHVDYMFWSYIEPYFSEDLLPCFR